MLSPVGPRPYHAGMAILKDRGVTLRRLDFSETSQVMVFFTRDHGKVRAIGKGIKRSTKTRFAVGIDLLEQGEMVLSVRQQRQEALANLTEWKQQRPFSGLREKLARLHAGQYVSEITAALTEDWDPHPGLYEGLVAVLDQLCAAPAILGPVVSFQRLLLHEIGSWPEVDVCVSCRRVPSAEGDLYFSAFEGGLLCRDCEAGFTEKRLVDRRSLPLVRGTSSITDAPPSVAPPHTSPTAAAFGLLNYHIAHQMGKEPLLAPKLI